MTLALGIARALLRSLCNPGAAPDSASGSGDRLNVCLKLTFDRVPGQPVSEGRAAVVPTQFPLASTGIAAHDDDGIVADEIEGITPC
jgi:hypothetical protein